jgi:alkylhydroperoxidase/carboxymuconolactone decarboxylase family protein YurZ
MDGSRRKEADSVNWTDELDPHFARAWSAYADGLAERRVLPERTRLLVAIGQCTSIGEPEAVLRLADRALQSGVPVAEIHEVLLQACLYAGRPVVDRTLDAFAGFVVHAGLKDELLRARLPAEGGDADRSLERERQAWPAQHHYRRVDDMLSRYDWRGISTSIMTQPQHASALLETLDVLDPTYASLWLNFIYQDMYSRKVLDDRTRTMVMIGNCLALASRDQTENHMRNAMALGATPDEVQEVIFQSLQYLGTVRSQWAIPIFQKIVAERRAR